MQPTLDPLPTDWAEKDMNFTVAFTFTLASRPVRMKPSGFKPIIIQFQQTEIVVSRIDELVIETCLGQ